MSQVELARISGVSQDVISRIESATIGDPSYSTVKRLLEALEHVLTKNDGNSKHGLTAEDIMNHNLVSVQRSDYLDKAWALMRKNNFSQLPVMDAAGKIVGGVSEDELSKFGNRETALKIRVEDVMSDAYPIVGRRERLSFIRSILQQGKPAVLVEDKGKAIGIVTKYDLIGAVFSKRPEIIG